MPHPDEPLYRIPDFSRRLSRRSFVFSTMSLAAAARFSGWASGPVTRLPVFPAYPFQLGVASGDPAPDGVVLWTRLAPLPLEGGGMPAEPVEVSWQISEDESMGRVVQKGAVIASPDWGHSVHVEVSGLRPGRWYWYQFKAGGEVSPKGRTRTAPAEDSAPDRLRFAVASCQHYEAGHYTAYEHMAREDLDLVIHLGDYIYEGGSRDGQCRAHNSPEVRTLEEYRNRYALYKSDAALQRMHAQAPWLVTWDDHEVENNYAADIPQNPNAKRAAFLRRRAAAYQAYYEHLPLRKTSLPNGPDMKIFRAVPFGKLARFYVLDTRQYRTDQPCDDKVQPPCGQELDENGTLLGHPQREWLLEGLNASPSTWNVLAQQVMMARIDRQPGMEEAFSMDQWPGYEAERRRLLRHFRDFQTRNPVVLTGDIHTNWANELVTDFDAPADRKTVAAEFVGCSISSSGNGAREPKYHAAIMSENPCLKFHNAERGYLSCEVRERLWRTDYKTVEYVDRQGSPLNTRASFALEPGHSELQRA